MQASLDAMRQLSLHTLTRQSEHFPLAEQKNVRDLISNAKSALIDSDNGPEIGELQGLVNACKSLFAPIRRLPVELLEIIFTHVCDSSVNSVRSLSPFERGGASVLWQGAILSFYTPARDLGMVCRYWMTISESLSNLWSTVEATLPMTMSDPNSLRLKTWASYVLGHLRENATCTLRFHALPFDEISRVLDAFGPYISRSMSLTIPITLLLEYFETKENLDFNSLISLTLKGDQRSSLPSHLWTTKLQTPMLRHVSFMYLDITDLHTVLLPWSNLTSVEFNECEMEGIVTILRQCPNIMELEIDEISEHGLSIRDGHTPFVLPSLRSFAYSLNMERFLFNGLEGDEVQSQVWALLYMLMLPQLNKLRIAIVDDEAGEWTESHILGLRSLISRSGCQIQDLVYESDAGYDPESTLVVDFLTDCTPHLQRLGFVGGELKNVIRVLAPNTDPPLSFPSLQHLSLGLTVNMYYTADFPAFPDFFIGMLEARWQADRKEQGALASVELTMVYEPVEQEFWNRLRSLRAEGLRISVLDMGGDIDARSPVDTV